MSRRIRVIFAAVAAVAMTTALVGTLQASVPFVGPSELAADLEGRSVQVEGRVEGITPTPDHLLLELSDEGTAVTVRYAYSEHRPLTLEEGRIVVAKGLYEGGVVEAHQVSVRAHE